MKIFSKNKPRNLWYDSPARGTTKLATVLLTALTVQLSAAATSEKVVLFESKITPNTGTTVVKSSFFLKKITGKVLDSSGLPIPGANIVAKGSNASTQTDFDGNFTIEVPDNVTKLVISYIGMESQEVSIGKSPLTITLKESGESLDEVVIVGYGTQKKSKITGSTVIRTTWSCTVYCIAWRYKLQRFRVTISYGRWFCKSWF